MNLGSRTDPLHRPITGAGSAQPLGGKPPLNNKRAESPDRKAEERAGRRRRGRDRRSTRPVARNAAMERRCWIDSTTSATGGEAARPCPGRLRRRTASKHGKRGAPEEGRGGRQAVEAPTEVKP